MAKKHALTLNDGESIIWPAGGGGEGYDGLKRTFAKGGFVLTSQRAIKVTNKGGAQATCTRLA